ncbi:hypothetical protein Pla52n_21670 [Stieleria varia]|uniref:Uncharacterized protein n=1 Tax=Stieleria varia TaxID=2528005 RepID=A0A5C6B596_9BACT|nr:hypothetical protein Pla52n_21670 [Stieleria varia]
MEQKHGLKKQCQLQILNSPGYPRRLNEPRTYDATKRNAPQRVSVQFSADVALHFANSPRLPGLFQRSDQVLRWRLVLHVLRPGIDQLALHSDLLAMLLQLDAEVAGVRGVFLILPQRGRG